MIQKLKQRNSNLRLKIATTSNSLLLLSSLFFSLVCLAQPFSKQSSKSEESTNAINVNQDTALTPEVMNKGFYNLQTKRMITLLNRSHYLDMDGIEDFPTRILQNLINATDPNHELISKEDVEVLKKLPIDFDKIRQTGDTTEIQSVVNEITIIILKRFDKIVNLDIVNKPASGEVSIESRAETNADLDRYWKYRTQQDIKTLKNAGLTSLQALQLLNNETKQQLLYFDDIKFDNQYELVMTAITQAMDVRSRYISPAKFKELNASIKYGDISELTNQERMNIGSGIILVKERGKYLIELIVPDSPANTAGLHTGMVLMHAVNQKGKRFLPQPSESMNGESNPTLNLMLRDPTQQLLIPPIELPTNNSSFDPNKISAHIATIDSTEEEIGIITIPNFYEGITEDTKIEIKNLQASGISGILIDLRNNGGGSLKESTTFTGLFINSGPVVQLRYSTGKISVNTDTDEISYYNGKVTVLVNDRTAGSCEIFAAAMQDYGRGIVMGETTFGHGTIQQHRALSRTYDFYNEIMGSLQFTIAQFYRISGQSNQLKGVTPDIFLRQNVERFPVKRQKSLFNVPWDSIKPAKYTKLANQSAAIQQLKTVAEKLLIDSPEELYLQLEKAIHLSAIYASFDE